MHLQIYDIVMLLVMLAAVGFGAWKGLAWQVASLSAIFASYFVALQLREPISQYINVAEPWDRVLAMLGIYLLTSLVIWIAFGLIRKLIDRVKLQDFDRHAGAVLGAVKGVILCIIITLFAVALLSDERKSYICCSYSGYFISKIIAHTDVAMPGEVQQVIGPYLDRLDRELGSHHDHYPAAHAASAEEQPAWESPIFEAERTARGVLEKASKQLDLHR